MKEDGHFTRVPNKNKNSELYLLRYCISARLQVALLSVFSARHFYRYHSHFASAAGGLQCSHQKRFTPYHTILYSASVSLISHLRFDEFHALIVISCARCRRMSLHSRRRHGDFTHRASDYFITRARITACELL